MATPFRIPQPPTIELARLVVGARVARFWHGKYQDWYEADVVSVDDDVQVNPKNPTDIPERGAFYVLLRYPAQKKDKEGDEEDVEWDLVFNHEDGEILELPDSARPLCPHFVPPGAAARSRQAPRVCTPHKGCPSNSLASGPGSSGQRKRAHVKADEQAGSSDRPAKRARGWSGSQSGARKRAVGSAQGMEDESEPEAWPRPRQARHRRPEPAASCSLGSGPADTAGVAGMLLRLQQDAGQPPGGCQQRAGPPADTLQPTPSQQEKERVGGGRRRASHFTQQGGSQDGPSTAGGPAGGQAVQEAQPCRAPRDRPLRQHADFSGVPDPAGAPGAGNLKRIEVVDFMCHHHLALELGPHVNLIGGTNGTGKSALLMALQCCLGARASDTGRYRTMSGLVRGDATQATVKVTLWNTGLEAYRRAELGPEVTVVWKMNRPSGASREVQDCRGRTVLRGSAAVKELVEALGINCSNPAIVLSQEMAKQFANKQGDADKYSCFMQATEFQKVMDHLLKADSNISGLKGEAQLLEAMARQAAEEEAALASKLQQMQEVAAWQRNQEDLEKCVVWGAVYGAERIIAQQRDALENTGPTEAASRQARINSFAQQIAGLDEELNEKGRRLAQAQAEMDGRQAERHSLRDAIKTKKREVAQLAAQLEEEQSEEQELAAQARELAAANADVAAELQQSTQQQKDAYRQRVGTCRDLCERAAIAARKAREHLGEREAALEKAQAEERGANRSLIEKKRQVTDLQADLRILKAAQGRRGACPGAVQGYWQYSGDVGVHSPGGRSSRWRPLLLAAAAAPPLPHLPPAALPAPAPLSAAPLARFGGEAVVELHRAVQQAVAQGRFSRPPIHVGSSLSLSDGRWAAAVDVALGPLLNGWIVHNGGDRALLQALRRRLSQQLSLTAVVMSFDTPPYMLPSARLPPPDKLSVMGVLRFAEGPNSHALKNALIDHAAIERKLLTDTQEEALALIRHAPFRRRISTATAADGSSAYCRGATETALPPPRGLRPRLVEDVSQQVADCRAELQQAQAALPRLQEEVQQKHQAALEAKRELDAAKQRLQAATQHRQSCDTQYADARSQQPLMLDADAAGGSDAAQLLAALQARKDAAEARVDAVQVQLAAARDELSRLQGRQKEAQALPQHMEAAMAEAEAVILGLGRAKKDLEEELNAEYADKAVQEAAGAEARRQLDHMERQLAGALEAAEAMCSREEEAAARRRMVDAWRAQGKSDREIEGLLDCKLMQRQAEALERRINQHTADAGASLEDLENEHAKVRNRRWKLDCRWDRSEKLLVALSNGYRLRKAKFRELRSSIATNVSKAFGQYMHYREHRGFVEVDYRHSRLALAVGPNGREPTRNMGSLSGGERSIASLAFILALGKEVNPPFHAMDEFDVFLDSINRRHALQFLLEFAVRHPDRQLLLLTPQDMAVLDDARQAVQQRLHRQLPGGQLPEDFVKVVRMPPARGGQQAPPPSQQD